MFCENCGKEIKEGNKFCSMCGWRVPEEAPKPVEEAPKVEEPKVEEPKTEEPKVEESKVEEPKVEEPKEEEPKTEEPKVEEPKAEEPKAEEPKTEEPKVEEPKAEEPKAEAPKTEAPKAEEPRPVSPTNPAEPVKKKKKGKKALLLIPILIVVLVVAVLANGSLIANAMKKTFSSPEKYYQWVEKNTIEEAASTVAEYYKNYLLDSFSQSNNQSAKAELTLELEDAGMDMLSLAGLAGYDLSWLQKASIFCETNVKDNKIEGAFGLGLGKEQILSVEAIMDMKDLATYVRIPELSKVYLGVEAGQFDSQYLEGAQEFNLDTIQTLCEGLPDKDTMEKLLDKYLTIALSNIDDVDIEKGEVVKADGVSQNCTMLEVVIDGKTLQDMAEAVLKELEDDDELKEIIKQFCKTMNELELDGIGELDYKEIYEEFQDAVGDMADSAEYLFDDDLEYVMTVYVDSKGNVIGRTFAYDDGWTDLEVAVLNPHDGKDFGYKASIVVDGMELAVTGSGKESFDKLDGKFNVKYNGTAVVSVDVKDFDTKKIKQGYLNGTFTVKAASGIGRVLGMSSASSYLADMEIVVDVAMSKKSNKLTLGLNSDDEKWGSISLEASQGSGNKVTVPTGKNVIYVEDEDDLMDWWDSIDWKGFIKKLKKTDLPDEVIDTVEELSDMDIEDLLMYMMYYL